MSLVTFTNPADSSTYTWDVNPAADSEQPLGKTRQIERTANTANVGAVKQQGDDGPLILDWSVNVRSRAMEVALWEWYVLCKTQTIHVADWHGDVYDGQIITLTRTRKAAAQEYAVYQIQIEVYALISGVLYDAGVTP